MISKARPERDQHRQLIEQVRRVAARSPLRTGPVIKKKRPVSRKRCGGLKQQIELMLESEDRVPDKIEGAAEQQSRDADDALYSIRTERPSRTNRCADSSARPRIASTTAAKTAPLYIVMCHGLRNDSTARKRCWWASMKSPVMIHTAASVTNQSRRVGVPAGSTRRSNRGTDRLRCLPGEKAIPSTSSIGSHFDSAQETLFATPY